MRLRQRRWRKQLAVRLSEEMPLLAPVSCLPAESAGCWTPTVRTACNIFTDRTNKTQADQLDKPSCLSHMCTNFAYCLWRPGETTFFASQWKYALDKSHQWSCFEYNPGAKKSALNSCVATAEWRIPVGHGVLQTGETTRTAAIKCLTSPDRDQPLYWVRFIWMVCC